MKKKEKTGKKFSSLKFKFTYFLLLKILSVTSSKAINAKSIGFPVAAPTDFETRESEFLSEEVTSLELLSSETTSSSCESSSTSEESSSSTSSALVPVGLSPGTSVPLPDVLFPPGTSVPFPG